MSIKNINIVNTEKTASGADELIVELMRKLINLTDEHVITSVDLQVTCEDPASIKPADDDRFKTTYLCEPYVNTSLAPREGYIPLIQQLYRSGKINLAPNVKVYKARMDHYKGFIDAKDGTAWINALELEKLLRSSTHVDMKSLNDELLMMDAVVWQDAGSPVCRHPEITKNDRFIVFYISVLKPVGGVIHGC